MFGVLEFREWAPWVTLIGGDRIVSVKFLPILRSPFLLSFLKRDPAEVDQTTEDTALDGGSRMGVCGESIFIAEVGGGYRGSILGCGG